MKHRIWIFALIVAGPGAGAGTVGADNNLVTTLLDVAQANDQSYVFTTPRDGWVFVADGDEESMRWVRTGEHEVRGSAGRHLIVRAIPEIIHCGVGYHPSPFLESFPKYNVAYLEKIGVFRNANVILERNPDPDFDIAKWRASGKQIRVRAGSNEAEPEHIYDYWASHRGMNEPYDGMDRAAFELADRSTRPFEGVDRRRKVDQPECFVEVDFQPAAEELECCRHRPVTEIGADCSPDVLIVGLSESESPHFTKRVQTGRFDDLVDQANNMVEVVSDPLIEILWCGADHLFVA